MLLYTSVLVFSGKVTKVGEISVTDSGRKVVSATIPARIGKGNDISMTSIEVSFWGEDTEKIGKLPLGTPVNVVGVPYIKPYINKDGQPDFSVVVSATVWNTTEPIPSAPATKETTTTRSAPIPAILKELMNAGKYKGQGMTYFEVIAKDREYINQLIVNDRTPENWKLKLIEMTKAYDDYRKKQG